MLVIMHHRYVAFLLEACLNRETLRAFISSRFIPPNARSYGFNNLNNLCGPFSSNSMSKASRPANIFKQKSLPFHHRFAGKRAYVAQPENSSAV